MAIQKEIWINDIVEAIYANNKFLEFAEDATSFLINGKFLHIPQAGGATDVEQDLTVFPVDATERTDLDLILPLTNFYVKPVRIAKIDEYELSFSKRNSVMSQNLANLTDRVALKVLFNWAAASGFINVATTGAASPFVRISKTTGAARAAELAGSTGNRKTALRQDIARMAAMLDAQDVPQDGRVALLTPQMYNDLFSDDVMLRRDVTNEADLKAGVINELMGFKIMKRSRVLNINAAYTGAKI
ncbi:phage capsid protein [Pseudarcicella hirudinis]|uniref:phage capsid protein n=1 Tax=Pseudarcicella hirudinis TaxID=1079859 RepID=UPI0035EABF9C